MRVRIKIDLDFDGIHTFEWAPTDGPAGVELPQEILERWTQERESFRQAFSRWKRVIDEVEEALYRTERRRIADPAPSQYLSPRGPLT